MRREEDRSGSHQTRAPGGKKAGDRAVNGHTLALQSPSKAGVLALVHYISLIEDGAGFREIQLYRLVSIFNRNLMLALECNDLHNTGVFEQTQHNALSISSVQDLVLIT